MIDRVGAIHLVQKSSKSELSSRFFGRSKFWGAKKIEFSNGRLPPEDGSVRPQTLGKRVSDIPDISFFDVENKFPAKFSTKIFVGKFFCQNSAKCLFWRSCAGLDVTGRCASKIHCQTYRFQPSTTLGGGVKREKTVFFRSFDQKTDLIPPPLL